MHRMQPPPPRLPLGLSRSIGDRILLGVLTPPLGTLTGMGCWLAFTANYHPHCFGELAVKVFLDEALIAVFGICVLGFIWAIAAPPRLPWILARRARETLIVFLWSWMVLGLYLYFHFA
jgi:hypothetical protein